MQVSGMQGCRLISVCCWLLLSFTSSTLLAASQSTPITKLLRNEAIESEISVNLMKANARFNQQHIAIHCFDGVVLLTGEVANDSLKYQAGLVARKTERVRQVHNQLSVTGTSSYLSRMNDSWLATKVRGKLMMNRHIKESNIQVTSSRGHIYLMGTLSPSQAKEAMRIAQQVDGVQGVTDLLRQSRAMFYAEQFE